MSSTNPDLGPVKKRVPGKEAEYLAELAVLQDELDTCFRSIEIYYERYARNDISGDDVIIAGSMFRDAVIMFCECFSDKDRIKPTPEEVYGHIPDWQSFYQPLFNLRNAFAAHNFGNTRVHYVGVECTNENGHLRPQRLAGAKASLGGWSYNEKDGYLAIVQVARIHNAKRLQEAQTAVWNIVAKMTSEELAALPDLQIVIPNPEDWDKGRSHLRQNESGRRTIAPPNQFLRTSGLE